MAATVHNEDIARIFGEIADLLEIRGENPFRIRAYRNGARELRLLPKEAARLVADRADLTRLPGIGAALAGKIEEIVRTGSCSALVRLENQLPADLSQLLQLPGLGPKRVHTLHYDLDIHTADQLHQAAKAGRLRTLPGFGPRSEERILAALDQHRPGDNRLRRAAATRYAEPIAAWLAQTEGTNRVAIAGSYRRGRETVGDLDLLVATTDPTMATDRLTGYDEVEAVQSTGDTRSRVSLRSGIRVDLRVVEPSVFGAALHYFTGSKAHNTAMRTLARRNGLKINEHGVFKGQNCISGDTEESLFAALGLPYIHPELREDRGEIEAARNGLLPTLVERDDLRGDLHCHTVATDGHGTLKEMAVAAKAQGLKYLAITDHSKRLAMVRGLDSRRLLHQVDEIDRLNEELQSFRLLKGIEVDILEDGGLDLPDRVLGRLDLVIGAVHSGFRLSRARQTRRILRAMDHPHFSILAHPTGRLIGERDAYEIDMTRVIRQARDRGCYLELNANPKRLDLIDTHCQMAREEGVLVSIDSDAHSSLDFANLSHGVCQARRGWLEAGDVLNTRTLEELLPLLRRTM